MYLYLSLKILAKLKLQRFFNIISNYVKGDSILFILPDMKGWPLNKTCISYKCSVTKKANFNLLQFH